MSRLKYTAIPGDTSLEAARRRFAILKKNKPSVRAEMALELNEFVRETMIAGIKRRHPDYSPEMVDREAIRLTLGNELFEKYFSEHNRSSK